jgi:hypothetical protein
MATVISQQEPEESKMQPRQIPLRIAGRFVGYVTVTDGETYAIEIKALTPAPRTLLLNGQPWSLEVEAVTQ